MLVCGDRSKLDQELFNDTKKTRVFVISLLTISFIKQGSGHYGSITETSPSVDSDSKIKMVKRQNEIQKQVRCWQNLIDIHETVVKKCGNAPQGNRLIFWG